MKPEGFDPVAASIPLAQVSTIWTMVLSARGGPKSSSTDAQQRFMNRYHGAVYRYMLTSLRDPDAAEELFQRFAERFVRGDFQAFDPSKGRFRDYLRVSLMNLIRDYRREKVKRRYIELDAVAEPTARHENQHESDETDFVRSWRDELLCRAWEALQGEKRRGAIPFDTVLQMSIREPKHTSAQLAVQLSSELELPSPPSSSLVRKTLQLAREKFAQLITAEVSNSLGNPTNEQLEQELIELGLIGYCRDVLNMRWTRGD